MPVPKRRCSSTRRNMRRAHHALKSPGMSECASCGEKIRPHRVCPKCGHYKDRLAISTEDA